MEKSEKHFKKGNKLGFVAAGEKSLTAHIGLKLTEEDKEALKKIPDWSSKLREAVKQLIKEYGD
ncbi:MAG: hypothetical protein ACFB2X_07310 [Rivularia sp. (in: cyanobacteria)]